MSFLFKYKSTRGHRRRSKRQHVRKVQLKAFNMLDHWSFYFNTAVYREDDWDDVKLLTFPGMGMRWSRKAALDINADAYRRDFRWNSDVDYEFVNRKPEFVLEVPKELSWPSRKVDRSEFPPDAVQLKSKQWFSISCVEKMALTANDRWMYLVRNKKKLRYAPGEWLYLDRKELGRIYPSMSTKTHHIANRNVFLMNVIRGKDGKPRELRVYSSKYKPLFKTTMDFADPTHAASPNYLGSWWQNTLFVWANPERYLKSDLQEDDDPHILFPFIKKL